MTDENVSSLTFWIDIGENIVDLEVSKHLWLSDVRQAIEKVSCNLGSISAEETQ